MRAIMIAPAARRSLAVPHSLRVPWIVALLAALACAPAAAQDRRNWFGDPFAQATSGLSGCPAPEGPLTTEDEMRREGHARIERGTTCWLQKKCDEPNAYKSDPQINAAVVAAIAGDARFAGTSVWVTTQRKFVFLQGCVRTRAQIGQLVELVRRVPRVEYVGDELLVGTRGKPPYRTVDGR
ncbi:BON domain-containing protein [Betaproteobacteria bacterium PRO7]|jgi:hypothetical protein|nr:BON domain-containing protein [Betaproteobacteria bacterium PRO7]